ncbi:transposase, partial [BEV proteobacterium]|nr:transposase [Candidatus Symbiopectobacterium sp. Chty_BC]
MKVEPGVALILRLVVVRLTDTHGKFIGRWTLLTNVGNEITSA